MGRLTCLWISNLARGHLRWKSRTAKRDFCLIGVAPELLGVAREWPWGGTEESDLASWLAILSAALTRTRSSLRRVPA